MRSVGTWITSFARTPGTATSLNPTALGKGEGVTPRIRTRTNVVFRRGKGTTVCPALTFVWTDPPAENSIRARLTRRPKPRSGAYRSIRESVLGWTNLTSTHCPTGLVSPPTSQDVLTSPSKALIGRNWGSAWRYEPYPDASTERTPSYTATVCEAAFPGKSR